jgi:hypothetical protein|nr:MAG TPA: hypothetical protein [Caudoviricetes sp.]
MNQNKKKMMKSKLKYYAQVIGVNLLAALVPILAVILIYGIGKLKNIYTHPCVLSQEIYDCCLEATIVVLAGFSVGLLLLGWADSWRKAKLFVLKSRREREKREEEATKICFDIGVCPAKGRVEPKVDMAEQKNIPTFENAEFEDISGLTAKEIWQLYKGRKVYVRGADYVDDYSPIGTLSGYSVGTILIVGFSKNTSFDYDDIVDNVNRETHPDYYVEKGFCSYFEFEINDVHVIKM